MKTVRIHADGVPKVLTYEDAPCPTPAECKVLIHMARMQNMLSSFYKK